MKRFTHSYLPRLLPRSDLPGAVQPTPWGLNRYVLLITYSFYIFVTGCVYMGWAPLATMILRAGGFSYLCDEDSTAFLEGPGQEQIPGVCNAQEAAVQKLYTLTLAVHFSSSALAGFLVDSLGPRLTALLGQSISFTGWCLLASTTRNSRYTLPAAFVLIGLGVDTSSLPHLCIARLFPGSAGLIITITGSAASASMFVPVILEYFGGNDLKVCWVYAFVGPGCMFFVALTLFPYRNFRVYDVNAKSVDAKHAATTHVKGSSSTEDQSTEHTQSRYPRTQPPDIHQHSPLASQEPESPVKTSYSCPPLGPVAEALAPPSPPVGAFVETGGSSVSLQVFGSRQLGEAAAEGSAKDDDLTHEVSMDKCLALPAVPGSEKRCNFRSQIFSERYVLVVLYFVGVVWVSCFYQLAPRRSFSTSVVAFLEVALPLSFIPCIILGKLADVWGIVRVMLALNTSGFLMYALAMLRREAAGYASVVFFCFYMSLFMGQIFVYIEHTFSPKHFSTLVGLAAMVGGLLSLVCNFFYEIAVSKGERAPVFPRQPHLQTAVRA
ncbi:uncharacterized protein LOC34617813 [Cyclospora cayetanensis]|uniref:Uncharacterized protein LOC34617813 n=1 Tax=Cyclospora cayetanensis TaxID=88456 RepID=A0A6P6RXJ7_9EIME|nr:uncharacterized protein LOC34617813 [Cyclospora cayetanensis]